MRRTDLRQDQLPPRSELRTLNMNSNSDPGATNALDATNTPDLEQVIGKGYLCLLPTRSQPSQGIAIANIYMIYRRATRAGDRVVPPQRHKVSKSSRRNAAGGGRGTTGKQHSVAVGNSSLWTTCMRTRPLAQRLCSRAFRPRATLALANQRFMRRLRASPTPRACSRRARAQPFAAACIEGERPRMTTPSHSRLRSPHSNGPPHQVHPCLQRLTERLMGAAWSLWLGRTEELPCVFARRRRPVTHGSHRQARARGCCCLASPMCLVASVRRAASGPHRVIRGEGRGMNRERKPGRAPQPRMLHAWSSASGRALPRPRSPAKAVSRAQVQKDNAPPCDPAIGI